MSGSPQVIVANERWFVWEAKSVELLLTFGRANNEQRQDGEQIKHGDGQAPDGTRSLSPQPRCSPPSPGSPRLALYASIGLSGKQ